MGGADIDDAFRMPSEDLPQKRGVSWICCCFAVGRSEICRFCAIRVLLGHLNIGSSGYKNSWLAMILPGIV